MATGPSVRYEMLFTSPEYQESCLEGIMSMPRKKYSLFVSDVLDCLGYSYDMIKLRQERWKEHDNIYNMKPDDTIIRLTTGGKGEGTALLYERDFDCMYSINDVICADNPQQFVHQDKITLFQTVTGVTSPGYTKLKLLKRKGVIFAEEIRSSLVESEDGSNNISSSFFLDAMKHSEQQEAFAGIRLKAEPISGPSSLATNQYFSFDKVYCFRCLCPDLLESWIARPRHHKWPSSDTIRYISKLDGHVVPVGFKGSDEMYREWRICYSKAELHLIQSLNETQIKLYILLKKIAKTLLKPVSEDMTSYITKNVVLWICELNGRDRFKPELLVDRIFDCLAFLRTCIIRRFLPSYMISGRNLIDRRIGVQQREGLTNLLSDLLKEGGLLLLRCSKIRDGMLLLYTCPAEYRVYGEKRDKVETLLLIGLVIVAQRCQFRVSMEEYCQLLFSNEEFMDIQTHIEHLIQFDRQALIQSGYTAVEIGDMFSQQLCQLLS